MRSRRAVVSFAGAACGLLVASAWPGIARAQDCAKAQTQTELNLCANADYKRADADLNLAYKAVIDRLRADAPGRTLLVDAQKAWLSFRDAECNFVTAPTAGGSVHPMVVSTCLAALTQSRTKMLRSYLSCEEGDLSCPLPPR